LRFGGGHGGWSCHWVDLLAHVSLHVLQVVDVCLAPFDTYCDVLLLQQVRPSLPHCRFLLFLHFIFPALLFFLFLPNTPLTSNVGRLRWLSCHHLLSLLHEKFDLALRLLRLHAQKGQNGVCIVLRQLSSLFSIGFGLLFGRFGCRWGCLSLGHRRCLCLLRVH